MKEGKKAWEEAIRRVTPYEPGEQPNRKGMIKLNTNENPYPPSPMVEEALRNLKIEQFRLYPDPESSILITALAEELRVKQEQIFVGVGSDDVLSMCFMTFFCGKKPILFPDITYSFYEVWAELYQIPYEKIPVNESFRIEVSDYKRQNGGILLANPNAPTGLYEPLSRIREILEFNSDSIVIIDEAYIDFGGESALSLLSEYENLLVVQTFSKSRSMAGMRVGYAVGGERLIKALKDVKYSFNSYTINITAQYLAAAALKDRKYFHQTVKKIVDTREKSKERFLKLGFTYLPSMTNFLFVKPPDKIDASSLFSALRQANIFVRYLKGKRTEEYLRITIGTEEEMDRLFEFLETIT